MPQAPNSASAAPKGEQGRKRSKLEELMEREKAAKKAKLEREKALSAAAGKAGSSGKAGSGRQDAPWLHAGITVKVGTWPLYGLPGSVATTCFLNLICMLCAGSMIGSCNHRMACSCLHGNHLLCAASRGMMKQGDEPAQHCRC